MSLKPLQQFICDECGEVIEKVEDGWIEWFDDFENPIHGFRIVHYSSASPRNEQGRTCYYPESSALCDHHLRDVTGSNGLAYLLSFFERNLGDPKELAEIIRRIRIPHYEEARQYLAKAYNDGFVDSKDYGQNDLKQVIQEYGNV